MIPKTLQSTAFASEDAEIVSEYFESIAKTSIRSAGTYASCLHKFLDFTGKTSILAITKRDFYAFLKNIDALDLSLKYKELLRAAINSFFKFVVDYCDIQGVAFTNPIVSQQFFQFAQGVNIESEVNKYLPRDDLKKILGAAYNANRRDYIIFLLMSRCGMRISEACTIRVENVHLEERYLLTGIEPTARKSSRRTGKPLVFCFAPEIAAMLREWISFLNITSGWLFPAGHADSESGHVHVTTIDHQIKEFYTPRLGITFTPHWFRHTLITERKKHFDGEMGRLKISEWESEILMNHVPKSIENRVYLNKPVEFRRMLADKYDPFKGLI